MVVETTSREGKFRNILKEEFDIRNTHDVDGQKSVATRMKQTGFIAGLRKWICLLT